MVYTIHRNIDIASSKVERNIDITSKVVFTTATVADLTKASNQNLFYWMKSRLYRPSGRPSTGRGSPRHYTFRDIVAIRMIVELRKQGCSLQKIRKAINYLKSNYPNESDDQMLARVTLLTDGTEVYIVTSADEIMNVISKQLVMFIVPLGKYIVETKQQIKDLPMEWTEPVKISGETYHLRVTRDIEDGGFVVQCKELPGALSQGDTAEEALNMGKDAIRTVLKFVAKRQAGRRRVKAG